MGSPMNFAAVIMPYTAATSPGGKNIDDKSLCGRV
jgi:hypothetical protein